MAWLQEIDVTAGVKLPTGGHWVNLPGSPFQVMARGSDTMGTMYVRLNPDITWEEWESFAKRQDEWVGKHPMAGFLGLR